MMRIYPVTAVLIVLTIAAFAVTSVGVPPWFAGLVVAGTALSLSVVLTCAILLFAGKHRRQVWTIISGTVRQDLAPLVALYRMIRRARLR